MALMTKLSPCIRIVFPSGVARDAASVPITVLAPGRFSTTIIGPCIRPTCSASRRARTSARGAARALMRRSRPAAPRVFNPMPPYLSPSLRPMIMVESPASATMRVRHRGEFEN
jgi:hypothetical protein